MDCQLCCLQEGRNAEQPHLLAIGWCSENIHSSAVDGSGQRQRRQLHRPVALLHRFQPLQVLSRSTLWGEKTQHCSMALPRHFAPGLHPCSGQTAWARVRVWGRKRGMAVDHSPILLHSCSSPAPREVNSASTEVRAHSASGPLATETSRIRESPAICLPSFASSFKLLQE